MSCPSMPTRWLELTLQEPVPCEGRTTLQCHISAAVRGVRFLTDLQKALALPVADLGPFELHVGGTMGEEEANREEQFSLDRELRATTIIQLDPEPPGTVTRTYRAVKQLTWLGAEEAPARLAQHAFFSLMPLDYSAVLTPFPDSTVRLFCELRKSKLHFTLQPGLSLPLTSRAEPCKRHKIRPSPECQ